VADACTALRATSLAEGVSYLLLFGVAMPLKYGSDPEWDLPVTIAGSIHGGLFILLGLLVCVVVPAVGWPWRRGGAIMLAAVIPFGAFVIDRRIRDWTRATRAARDAPSA